MFEQVCGNGEARGDDGIRIAFRIGKDPNGDIHKGTCT